MRLKIRDVIQEAKRFSQDVVKMCSDFNAKIDYVSVSAGGMPQVFRDVESANMYIEEELSGAGRAKYLHVEYEISCSLSSDKKVPVLLERFKRYGYVEGGSIGEFKLYVEPSIVVYTNGKRIDFVNKLDIKCVFTFTRDEGDRINTTCEVWVK